jgi:hypothetical protein
MPNIPSFEMCLTAIVVQLLSSDNESKRKTHSQLRVFTESGQSMIELGATQVTVDFRTGDWETSLYIQS